MTAREDEAAALAGRLGGAMTEAYDLLAVYLGDRLGLYAALDRLGASTSAELAAATGTDERYVREWLEHQATGGFVTTADASLEPGARRFALPAGHADVLVDTDSLSYSTSLVRMVVGTLVKAPDLTRVYRTGEGISWSEHGDDVVRGQEGQNRPMFLRLLGHEWLPAIPDVHARLSGGGRVADIGCGAGWSSIGMALAYPATRVDGFDLDGDSIRWAKENAESAGVSDRVTFYNADAATVAAEGGYDLAIAIEMVHDLARPVDVLRTMRRLAAPSGTVLVIDENVDEAFAAPGSDMDRLMYGFSIAGCLPNGRFGAGSAATGTVMRPATLRGYALEAGFRDVEVLALESDLFRFYRLVA